MSTPVAGEPPGSKPNGNGNNHALPRWFATRGPRPYFLAEHWSLILAAVSSILVLVNTIVSVPGIDVHGEVWINAVAAWLTAAALYLKGRQPTVNKVAAWRAKVRAEQGALFTRDAQFTGNGELGASWIVPPKPYKPPPGSKRPPRR